MNIINYMVLLFAGPVVGIVIYMSMILRSDTKLKNNLIGAFGKPPVDMDYNIEKIKTYYLGKIAHSDYPFAIDDNTWGDLDMDKVFKRVNACQSSVGEEYLYDCMRNPAHKESNLWERESFIKFLKGHPDVRLKIQVYLAKLGKSNSGSLSSLVFNEKENLLKYPLVYKILSFIPILCVGIMFANVNAGIGCIICAFIINMIVHYIAKRRIIAVLPAISYFASVMWCVNKLRKIESLKDLPSYFQMEKLCEDLQPLAGRIPEMMRVAVTDIDIIAEYLKILFLVDIRNYNKVIHGIKKHMNEFHDLYTTVGEIDLSICTLSFRESIPFFSTPLFHNEKLISFEELYHPLLATPVTNSGEIRNNVLITGSNASGKSTFIKALAVNEILAQTIFTCTATKFSTRFSLVISSMAVRDNLSEGESYFITEMKSLKRILDKISMLPCSCYIDEILRGTNTIERIAASASVLGYMNNKNCLCIVASHDTELAQEMKSTYDNYHFSEQFVDDRMTFDYKLKRGISQTRNAIKLLHYMGFDNQIVENANRLDVALEGNEKTGNNPG